MFVAEKMLQLLVISRTAEESEVKNYCKITAKLKDGAPGKDGIMSKNLKFISTSYSYTFD